MYNWARYVCHRTYVCIHSCTYLKQLVYHAHCGSDKSHATRRSIWLALCTQRRPIILNPGLTLSSTYLPLIRWKLNHFGYNRDYKYYDTVVKWVESDGKCLAKYVHLRGHKNVWFKCSWALLWAKLLRGISIVAMGTTIFAWSWNYWNHSSL